MISALVKEFRCIVEPVVQSAGLELWGLEYLPRRHVPLLRIFIDTEDGVNVDDCERVSRQLSSVLEVEDTLPGNCDLEVSSPGIDRSLYDPEQYQRFVGAMLRLRLAAPLAGRRNFKGRLLACRDGKATLDLEGQRCDIPLEQVERANIISAIDAIPLQV